ncbi:MAG: hypothetical protein KGI29_04595 [Pseudomonadota bacterium]|nr:hypothetical protein [Pseudomonadota bacterium]MDE3037075.1 hypothetical protein [Pseudomonadota bacterium]
MSLQAHLDSLAEKRTDIKQKIAEELARPLPDFLLIHGLKKENMRLKQATQQCLIMLAKPAYHASS